MDYNVIYDSDNGFEGIENSDNLKNIVNSLMSQSNAFIQIKKFLFENKMFREEYDKIDREMANCGGCGLSSTMCGAIENIFSNLEIRMEQEDSKEDVNLKMRMWQLANENKHLKESLQKMYNFLKNETGVVNE